MRAGSSYMQTLHLRNFALRFLRIGKQNLAELCVMTTRKTTELWKIMFVRCLGTLFSFFLNVSATFILPDGRFFSCLLKLKRDFFILLLRTTLPDFVFQLSQTKGQKWLPWRANYSAGLPKISTHCSSILAGVSHLSCTTTRTKQVPYAHVFPLMIWSFQHV